MAALRLGAKVPSSGPLPARLGIGAMAARLEAAGFASLWCSDHVVMTRSTARSHYPFSADGQPTWDPETPWYDAVVAMTAIAEATEHAEVGVAVLVLPLRAPVVLAKQVASIDVLSGGRVALGLGAGWYREEFEALGVDFDSRGRRMDEWLEILADCWTGRPAARSGLAPLPEGVVVEPTPSSAVPRLIGGMSDVALQRAARNDGWLALQHLDDLAPHALSERVERMRALAAGSGPDPAQLRVVLRVLGTAGRAVELAGHLDDLAAAGVTEVIVDVDWDAGDGPESAHDALAAR